MSETKKIIEPTKKLCPFQSTPDEEVECTEKCVLYRKNKMKGYNCPITELTTMSWIINGRPKNNY